MEKKNESSTIIAVFHYTVLTLSTTQSTYQFVGIASIEECIPDIKWKGIHNGKIYVPIS